MSRKLWCFLGVHEWKILGQATWKEMNGDKVVNFGPLYHLQCGCCGAVRARKLR